MNFGEAVLSGDNGCTRLSATTILLLGPNPFEVSGSLLFHSRPQCVQSRDSDFHRSIRFQKVGSDA
jgi:hypothetical protein